MEQKTVKIISAKIAERAEKVIDGNTCIFDYNYENNSNPREVQFQVVRGIQSDEDFTGSQEIGGSLDGTVFTSYNLTPRQRGDGALLDEVWAVCEAIINGTIVKEQEDEASASE